MIVKFRNIALIAAAGIGLAGCVDGGYGSYGVSAGYGSPGYDQYAYGYGYGSPYYGWYDDYYYPGTGYYVYDHNRRPYRWNDTQRSYWEGRGRDWRGDRDENWGGWRGPGDRIRDQRETWRQRGNLTPEQRQAWQDRRNTPRQNQAQGERGFTPEQRQAWQARRGAQGAQGSLSGDLRTLVRAEAAGAVVVATVIQDDALLVLLAKGMTI